MKNVRLLLVLIMFQNISSVLQGITPKNDKGWYGEYEKRFTIEISNPSNRQLKNYPIIVDISKIKKEIPDFNPLNYVLIEIGTDENFDLIPSQADDIDDNDSPDELVFVHSFELSSLSKTYCYYSPEGSSTISYPKKADAYRDWTEHKRELGWESNWCAYSFYDGRMDFYAKRQEGLQLKRFIKETNYHELNDWGMDVLIIGDKSGIGSITIWQDGTPTSTIKKNKENKIRYDRKILASGPVRSLVEVCIDSIYTGTNKYKIVMMMSAFAENHFSRQDVIITSEKGDSIVYSPGMEKLNNDEWQLDSTKGILTSWGFMDQLIGHIGLGLIFYPEEYAGYSENNSDRFVKLKIPNGEKRTYYTIGGWEKESKTHSSPTGTDWQENVQEHGYILKTHVKVQYENLESRF